MYLLLNNNKYLDQIVNSLLYSLKKNNIDCDIVYELQSSNKKETINIDNIENKSKNDNIKNNNFISDRLKKIPVSSDIGKKRTITNKLDNIPLGNDIIQHKSSTSTGNSIESLLSVAKQMGNILPTNININKLSVNNKKTSKSEEKEEKKEEEKKEEEKKDILKNDTSNTYIIFNINIIEESDLPLNFIVYNFEQLNTSRKWNNSFFKKCKKALKVLDYSLENISLFELKNINAHHLPFGWCSVLETSYKLDNKDIDILFLGSLNKNRVQTITNINFKNPTSNLYIQDKCFGEDFEKVISKSKVGFNIHYYEGKTVLELTRIVPLICAGVEVISERSDDIYYDKIFNSLVTFCKKEDMGEIIKDKILNYNLNTALKKRKKLKKKLNFETIISENIFLFKN